MVDLVYVVDVNGNPLMPTSRRGMVRYLLKHNKAIIIKHNRDLQPFTIKLLYETSHYVQECTLGVDIGSGTIGTSVVRSGSHDLDKVIYTGNTILRNDIKEKMDRRRMYRRDRRNRKTRYRKCRFLNRKNSIKEDRFSPTLVSKIRSHIREIELIKSILPITKIIFEVGKFDMAAMDNPELRSNPSDYQHGKQYGYENVKAYVRHRDNYTCQLCKKTNIKLHVHHIVEHSKGGSNQPSNLITLCNDCHDKVHRKNLKLEVKGHKTRLAGASQMNVISSQLQKIYPEAEITYGYITSFNRKQLSLPKDHFIDASVIASQGKHIKFEVNKVYIKVCTSKGEYKLYKGNHSEMPIRVGKIKGIKRNDLVKFKGKKYFVRGRAQDTYADLNNLNHEPIKFKDSKSKPKLRELKRLKSGSSLLIGEKSIKELLDK